MVFPKSIPRQLLRPTSSTFASSSRHATYGGVALPRASSLPFKRTLTATAARQGKVLLVLYDVGRPSSISHPKNQLWNGDVLTKYIP